MFKAVSQSLGCIFAILAIVMGAFAAHGLKSVLMAEPLDWIKTASFYLIIHAFLLLVLPSVFIRHSRLAWSTLYCVLLGMIFFSGSLYLMAFDIARLGLLTPLGGSLFILAWILILISQLRDLFKLS